MEYNICIFTQFLHSSQLLCNSTIHVSFSIRKLTMSGGLINLWKKWEIQILVLLSFRLQLIVLGFARIRRRKGPALLRILLWLAYLMADSTAIYTLGHLSLRARSTEKQLVPLWAPLLLMHLGGPDTITAYAFEDNQLWLRHLLNLAVQVMGAAYVLYQSVGTQSQRTLVLPSILMFGTGLLKYGERTWALKCANIDNIRSSLDLSDDQNRRQPCDDESEPQNLIQKRFCWELTTCSMLARVSSSKILFHLEQKVSPLSKAYSQRWQVHVRVD